jgi:hypothetical protein
MAGVFNDQGRAAGRLGMGGVMGSKKLKALACGGTFVPHIAHPDDLNELCKIMVEDVKEYHATNFLSEYGTSAVYSIFVGMNDTPFKNWKSTGWMKITRWKTGSICRPTRIFHTARKSIHVPSAAPHAAILELKDHLGNTFETHRPNMRPSVRSAATVSSRTSLHLRGQRSLQPLWI